MTQERNDVMNKAFSWLTGGVLFDRFSKVRDNFYEKIDENIHADTYRGEHDLKYAEPEFTGKFMDICARYYEREGDERALRKGMAVVNSIKENIRDDGYLGMLGEGNLFAVVKPQELIAQGADLGDGMGHEDSGNAA